MELSKVENKPQPKSESGPEVLQLKLERPARELWSLVENKVTTTAKRLNLLVFIGKEPVVADPETSRGMEYTSFFRCKPQSSFRKGHRVVYGGNLGVTLGPRQ